MWPFTKPSAKKDTVNLSDERVRQIVGDHLLAKEAELDAREEALIDAFNAGVEIVNIAVASLRDAERASLAKLLLEKSEHAFKLARGKK